MGSEYEDPSEVFGHEDPVDGLSWEEWSQVYGSSPMTPPPLSTTPPPLSMTFLGSLLPLSAETLKNLLEMFEDQVGKGNHKGSLKYTTEQGQIVLISFNGLSKSRLLPDELENIYIKLKEVVETIPSVMELGHLKCVWDDDSFVQEVLVPGLKNLV